MRPCASHLISAPGWRTAREEAPSDGDDDGNTNK